MGIITGRAPPSHEPTHNNPRRLEISHGQKCVNSSLFQSFSALSAPLFPLFFRSQLRLTQAKLPPPNALSQTKKAPNAVDISPKKNKKKKPSSSYVRLPKSISALINFPLPPSLSLRVPKRDFAP